MALSEEGGTDLLEGRRATLEALKADRPLERILIAKGSGGSVAEIRGLARERGIRVVEVERSRLDQMVPGRNHQGVLAEASAARYAEVGEILDRARLRGESPLVLVLDSLTDPRNAGALLRSAEAVGAHGAIWPEHQSAGLGATVARTSAGAVEWLPVARVTNLTRTLKALKDEGLWVVGLDPTGPSLFSTQLPEALAVVVGSEGKGIRPLVRRECDILVSLPMLGHVASLNASVAGGVLLYELLRRRLNSAP